MTLDQEVDFVGCSVTEVVKYNLACVLYHKQKSMEVVMDYPYCAEEACCNRLNNLLTRRP